MPYVRVKSRSRSQNIENSNWFGRLGSYFRYQGLGLAASTGMGIGWIKSICEIASCLETHRLFGHSGAFKPKFENLTRDHLVGSGTKGSFRILWK
jgi:hypothetical protein